jgi:hypothetical protein
LLDYRDKFLKLSRANKNFINGFLQNKQTYRNENMEIDSNTQLTEIVLSSIKSSILPETGIY